MPKIEVTLPPLGEDAGDVAKVSFWYVEEGEDVAEGDNLVQMLTEKATFDVPSPDKGTVREILVAEDEEVAVGQTLCILATVE